MSPVTYGLISLWFARLEWINWRGWGGEPAGKGGADKYRIPSVVSVTTFLALTLMANDILIAKSLAMRFPPLDPDTIVSHKNIYRYVIIPNGSVDFVCEVTGHTRPANSMMGGNAYIEYAERWGESDIEEICFQSSRVINSSNM